MKSTKILFLFLFISGLYIISNVAYAQEQIDSADYYSSLIRKPTNSDDLAKAYVFFDSSRKQSMISGNIFRAISDLRYIAQTQNILGFINESENSAIKALKLLETLQNNDTILEPRVGIYNHLGMIYRQRKDFTKALEYYNMVLDIATNPKNKNKVYNNRAFVYLKEEKYELAIEELLRVYDYNISIGDKQKIARSLDNIGFAQSKINDSMALSNLMSALELRKEIGYTNGILTSYLHLGDYYKDRKDIEKSLDFANKAYNITKSTKNVKQKEAALSLKLELKDDIDFSEYKKVRDSISDFQRLSRGTYAALKYEKETEKKRADANKLEEEKQKRSKLMFQAIGAFILLLAVFLYFVLRSRHKKDKINQAYFKETEFSKKVHDELANDMSDLMNYVEHDIETSIEKKTLLLDNIEDIYMRTRDISTETGSIDLIHFSDSLSNLLLQHNREGTKVVTNDINTIHWEKVPDYKKMIVFRCLQELMVNMKKHSKAKLVSIIFKEHNSKKEIRYVDDGIGVSIEQVNLNGLLNVESRIKSIHGTFNFTTSKGNGFKATLEFNS